MDGQDHQFDFGGGQPIPATIVVPCFNEGGRLSHFLRPLAKLAGAYSFIDVLVVDDGSAPAHAEETQSLVAELKESTNPRVSLLRLATNEGKGAALGAGFSQAKTPIIGFADADGATPAEECLRVLAKFSRLRKRLGRAGTPIPAAVIGSRVKMLGMTVERHMRRHYMGRVFATLLSVMFRIPVYDSQCGCKFFWMESVRPLLTFITSKRWLWDTQLTVLCYARGLPILEEPVSWRDTAGSKVSMLRDPLRMTFGLMKFRAHLMRSGFYHEKS